MSIDRLLDQLHWEPIPAREEISPIDGLPYATHQGELQLEGFRIRVFQLSDGRRIMDAEDVQRFFEGRKWPA